VGLHLFAGYLNKYALIYRKKRVEAMNDYTKHIVKIIMSKFEILQNNKIKQEVNILDNYTNQASQHILNLNNYLFSMYSIPDFMITVLRLFVFIII